MRYKYALALALSGSLSVSLAASAQDFNPYSAPYAGVGQLGLITNQIAITQAAITKAVPEAKNGARPATANPATLRFTPSLPQRRQNLDALVRSAERNQPGAGENMRRFFDAGDPVVLTGGVMTPLGLRTDNLADALSFYLLGNWMAVNRKTALPSRTQALALRGQMERFLLNSRQFQSTPNAEKQKTAEEMIVSGLLAISAYASAEGNAEATANITAQAAQNVKGLGLDLSTLELGLNGFEPRRED
jgi:hypothetical protein